MLSRPSPLHHIVATAGLCLLGAASCSKNSGSPVVDAAFGPDAGLVDAPTCPASCDDNNPCTVDSCDPTTYQCVHANVPDGTSCQGKPCTTNSICQGGLCLDGPFKKCTVASDQCHVAGPCSPKTGDCTSENAPEGKTCDDGNLCTYADQCKAGVCVGTPLVCPTTCDPATGSCPGGFPTALLDRLIDNASWPVNSGAILRSPDGQIFAAGAYVKQIDLGSGPIVQNQDPTFGAADTDVFLARLDPSALKATWAVTFVGPRDQSVTSFAVDGAGHLGVIGPLMGSITVAGNELEALRPGDQYILGASTADGSGLWVRRVNLQSGTEDSRTVGLRAIAGDPNGSSFVVCGTVACATGPMRGDAGPDPNPAKDFSSSLACKGGTDLVVARIDSSTPDAGTNTGNGTIVWADEVGGINDEYCGTLTMDAQSNTYVVGTYRFGSEVAFGSTTLPMVDSAGSTAWMYLAKLGPDNKWIWAKRIGAGAQSITPTAILAVDNVDGASSDVIVAGTIEVGSLLFSTDNVGVVLDSPNFMARFDGSTGEELRWVKGMAVVVNSMAADGGHILATGSYSAAGNLGSASLSPPLKTGAFIAEIDGSNGAVVAAKGYGSSQYLNSGAGVVAITGAAGSDENGSLLLLSYASQLDLGPPIGVLRATATASTASCLARIAP